MVATRSGGEARKQFKNILENVFDLPQDSPIILSLKKSSFDTFFDVMTLSDEAIAQLKYDVVNRSNNKRETISLDNGHQGWIRAFVDFIRHNKYESESRYFNTFRVKIFDPERRVTYLQPTTGKKDTNKDVEQFKKNTKRDKSQYSVLKYDWQWDGWRRSTISTARAHDCEEIFDVNYKPTVKEKALFTEKQIFIYSVFEEKLKTDTGKHLVRKYESQFDAQTIYKRLSEYAKESTHAHQEASKLLKYISSVLLHKISWKGPYYSFILHWCDKVRLYEDLIPIQDHFTNNAKMAMLQNAVSGIESLDNVRTTEDHNIARGQGPLKYQAYLSLLLSAASIIDKRRGFSDHDDYQKYSTKGRIDVNVTDYDYNINHMQQTQEIYNIDTVCLEDNENNHRLSYETNTSLHHDHQSMAQKWQRINGCP